MKTKDSKTANHEDTTAKLRLAEVERRRVASLEARLSGRPSKISRAIVKAAMRGL